MNIFAIAWDSIWHHRTRSFLTALGIIIGVFAVVTLTSLGSGVQSYVNQKFSTIGANLISVTPALPSSPHHHDRRSSMKFSAIGIPSTLTEADVSALNHSRNSALKSAAGVLVIPELLSYHGNYQSASIAGVSPSIFSMLRLKAAKGSLTANGVVLGYSVKRAIFGNKPALGKKVKVGTKLLDVTGVLSWAQSTPSSNPNHAAYLPLKTALTITGQKDVSEIVIAASSAQSVTQAVTTANHILSKNHPSHNYAITTVQSVLKAVTSTTSVITDFLAGIAGISLLVGGIGIMNIMLVTVSERFREIGIRKALGARDSDILIQFLSESILLALIGGLFGTALSGLATHIVSKAVGIPAGLTLSAVVTAVVFSIGVGAVFGVLPAMRAARLMPAEALRTE